MSKANHDELANVFVQLAGRRTGSSAELLVLIESTMVATLLLLTRLHKVQPDHASIMLEAALQRATERFAERAR